MSYTLNTPVRPPQTLDLFHPEDQDAARVIISISQQTPEDVILQHISQDGEEATLVAGGHAARCFVRDIEPLH